ncbi:hypothetical protein [Nocardia sp. NPDC051981]|uniref:hypothetical protein n=1 Tax=Nocardia sp. NPDC051981 TaxID=3155417 RepID=UPI00341C12B2
MGNAQALPNGNTLVSWGMTPRISEFTPSGELVYDAVLPFGSYRAYLDSLPSWPARRSAAGKCRFPCRRTPSGGGNVEVQ